MVTRKNKAQRKAERLEFWAQAYLSAELSVLIRKGMKLTPQAVAHLCGEFADASLNEFIRRQR